ncbi:uncharacterized protein METZ01_LOCUS163779 [marine metagenome]|uniref:Carboxypeptidase regulatory-like domain-containing protein n=1 Tax=marine metagenome TaxID=408172 RepID=A0A382BAU4_9ZZZZ
MSSFKKSKLFFPLVFILLLLLQNSCSVSEYGEASDYEKYGATATASATGSGTIFGAVLTSSGSVLSGVSVSYASGTSTYSTTTDSSGLFTQSSLATGTYTLSYSKSGYWNETQYATLETDGETIELLTLRMLSKSRCSSSTGDISGTITSALSSSATIEGATIKAYRGLWSKRSLEGCCPVVVKTATTPDNGTYTLSDMPTGHYTLLMSASGYISGNYWTVSCGDKTGRNKALSPTLPSNSMRIILSWEETSPVTGVDLDSHLTGPDNGSGRFHVYYDDNETYFYFTDTYTNCSGCSISEKLDNVTLNRDETGSSPAYAPPGIETFTISNVKSSGTYRYSVHDYSNGVTRGLTNSDNLSISGASVSVDYNDGSTTTSKTYGVPTNKIGTLWEVFTFTTSGGFVKEKNMSNEATPGNIQ